MKNYNIIFNGEVIQTINASSFFKNEFGSNTFQDKEGNIFCVVPKKYMVVETENLTEYQQLLKDIILNLESTMHNDKERGLVDFDSLDFWKEQYRREWRGYFQELYTNAFE